MPLAQPVADRGMKMQNKITVQKELRRQKEMERNNGTQNG